MADEKNDIKTNNTNVCASECEVYSRIVGYFRPVQNWNIGKKEEYKHRQEFCQEKAADDKSVHVEPAETVLKAEQC